MNTAIPHAGNYRHIIFDLDGTLSDPREGIFKGLRHSLTTLGHNIAPDHDFSYFIGPPIHDAFYMYHLKEREHVMNAVKIFREYYSVQGLYENQLYEGMKELLGSLQQSGKRLFVATNKPQPFAERILRHFDIYDHFTGVYGVDIEKEKVSKEELVERLMNDHKVTSESTALVGDTKYDIMAAHAFGLDPVAVTYGFGERKELEEMKPAHVAASVGELRTLFAV